MSEPFSLESFERATDIMAMWLARFRAGDPGSDEQPNDNDKLEAGLLAGALAANGLLATKPDMETRYETS